MALYRPTPGLKGKKFKLSVLTKWNFNFCVRSSPLRGIADEGGSGKSHCAVKMPVNVAATRCECCQTVNEHGGGKPRVLSNSQ